MAQIVPIIEMSGSSCFEQYVGLNNKKLAGRLPDALIQTEEGVLRERINNLSSQIDQFLASPEKSRGWLVLGKVQSGKTSHLLGVISYAASKEFALASLFTGVNLALNNQGMERIQKDLSDACVEVFEVPTNSTGKAYSDLKKDVLQRVKARSVEDKVPGVDYPMPVLVTLKNPSRVKTLEHLLQELQNHFEDPLPYLMIDDEADQASQNANVQKNELSQTYKAIAALRESGIKHALLAYTATPQAVLLSEREGLLRPDYCVTVPPKFGYFGLDEFLSNAFADNLIVVDDVTGRASTYLKAPDSLRRAFTDFLLATLVRRKYPQAFYSDAIVPFEMRPEPMRSTQFMIHESSANKDQTAMFDLFREVKDQMRAVLLESLAQGVVPVEVQSHWNYLRSRLTKVNPGLLEDLQSSDLADLVNLVQQNKVLVVNADTKGPTFGEPFPVKDDEWEVHSNWTLIGGDILGRGLTIPQLVTSYFLRASKRPNFDTVSQQMRFCGYRRDYSSVTNIYAHQETLDLFRYMQKIESVVWRHAAKWDRHRTTLTGKIPPIMYAAPLSAKLEPTRKNVRDPNLRDIKKSESSELLYSARHIFNPSHVYQNVKSIRNWFDGAHKNASVTTVGDWTLITDLLPIEMQNLIPVFVTAESNKQELKAIGELFDEAMAELGLADRPSAVYIKSSLLASDDYQTDPTGYWTSQAIERGMYLGPNQPDLAKWLKFFGPAGNSETWGSLRVPHVGGSQRKLVKSLPFDGTVVIVEPIKGVEQDKTVFGLGFTIFKPKDFEIRMIGHA